MKSNSRNEFDVLIRKISDIEVPEHVWERYRDTLSNLPEQQIRQITSNRRFVTYAASAAAFLLVFFAVCFSNPALAAKIPFIGRIFTEVQESFTFSGEYDKKAEVLSTENTDNSGEGCPAYTAKDAGVTVTASEIYCDGLSVFLTAEINVEQGGLENLPSGLVYLDGKWKIAGETEEKMLMNNNLEGKVIDDNTFVGMVKFDLDGIGIQDGTIDLEISGVGYDDRNDTFEDDISASHKINGNWDFCLPFTVDTQAVKKIRVDQENRGYRLKEVFVSPYQVITETDVPYTEKKFSRADFEKMMLEKTGGSHDFGITYEEYMEQSGKKYAECNTILFNQDGEKLISMEEVNGRSISAVHGKKISKLYIYIVDSFDVWIELYEKGMNSEAADQAVLYAEIDLENES